MYKVGLALPALVVLVFFPAPSISFKFHVFLSNFQCFPYVLLSINIIMIIIVLPVISAWGGRSGGRA